MIETSMIAGLWMGEGCLELHAAPYRETILGYRMYPRVHFTNTDGDLIQAFGDWLMANGIPKYCRHYYLPKNRINKCYIITVSKWRSVLKFLDLVEPFLIGNKAHLVRLLRRAIAQSLFPISRQGSKLPFEAQKERFMHLMRCREEMQQYYGNAGHSDHRRKYTLRFFEELWDVHKVGVPVQRS